MHVRITLSRLIMFVSVLIALTAFPFASVAQQSHSISGVVLDETLQPVVGAAVVERGTQHGVITDLNGEFTITIAGKSIVVSCMGFEDKVIEVGKETHMRIILKEDSKFLDEVVVTAFATQKKVNVT